MAGINFESLNLDEEEELNFVLGDGEDADEQHDLNLCLVGRFVHDRPIRFNSMNVCLADVWRPVKVKEATQGLYLFKFFHPLDVEEVLKGGSWTFDSFTLIIDRLKIGVALQDIPIFHVNFWVQIHDVPIGMMLETVGKGLTNYIGEFVEYDKNNNTSFWRKYMRVKVRVDVRSPLKIEKKIKLNGGKGGVVKFKYEKLGLFCFVCGRLGHVENKCEVKYAMDRDDGRRSGSNEIKAEVRHPGRRVGSRWLHEEGRNMADVDASNTSGERGSQQTGPTQTIVASPRESRGPENGEIMSTVRGHIPPLRPTSGRQSSSIQGSFIEAPAISLISNRPILAITNDNTTTTQLTTTPALNEGNHLDPDDMDTQVERKRRRAASLVAEGPEVRTHQHFLSAAIGVEGRSGGLPVFWKDSSKCRVLNYTRNFINMLVEDEQWGEWRLTCYCGYPERSRRRAAWDLLRVLGNMSSIPWCIIGDFNDLLAQADKKGIHPHPNGLCMGFRQVVSDCDLTDIPIEGHPFTWIKSRGTPHVIEERLDRAMASTSWLQLFPQEPDLEDVVVVGWGGRENLEVVNRVTRCANKLQRRMNELRGNQDEEGSIQYQELSERHATWLIQEEGYWKQRAKMHWLQEADMNTRFFHMSATVRSKKKKVTKLIVDNGTEAHTQEELCEVAKSYFDTLFKPRDGDQDPVLNLIQPRVTDDDNFVLTAPITKVEIQQALFQMHPDKSPRPDGFNPTFYQRFWEQCSDDIFSVASTWLERGYFPTSLNETNICLIPKCDNPTSMKDLRPISLCNVLYKIISKVLANRLKCCLDKCVSQEQSAFVEGRSILDNVLIATKVIHALKRKTKGRRGELTLKIDIIKAYDKVDWGFLRGVMTKMGFTDVWIRWVMMCVSSVNYSVLMNSDRVGPISPGRGLRQGDPLSPYLFILVTECLTAFIHQAVGRGDLHGVRICRGAPEVSHLLFADDCFLFCRANVAEAVGRGDLHGVRICRGAPEVSHLLFADDCFLFCRANVAEVNELMRILHTYETASDQEVNLVKSEVFISRNMSQAAKEDLSRILGVKLVLGTGIYLGLPSMVGRSKKAIFSYIKDRIWKRINSWRGRALSKADKEIMIKSVLQAIPSYVMSIHWLAWERLACPKAHGGLGFRNFEAFNKAMVAKQVWNIVQNPNSLVAKLIKARYFPHSSLFEAPLGYNPNFAWRSMWQARQILSLGCRWRIGSGDNIRVMHDPWLRGSTNRWVPSPQPTCVYQLSVRDLLHENYKAWNIVKVRNLFSKDVAEKILETPLVSSVREDKVVWEEERNKCYLVKSGYKLAIRYIIGSDKYHVVGNWNGIWKAQAPHKARHLLWRLCRGCLLTRSRLLERQVECTLNCPVCDEEIEDELHIFFRCAVARDSWSAAGLSSILHNATYQQTNAMDRIFAVCSNESSDTVGRVAMLLWCIWQNRNDKLWNDNVQMPHQIGRHAFDAWNDWYSVHKLQSNNVSGTIEADLVRWEKPALDWVKCNVDVAFVSGSGRTSVGLCFRDNSGHFMAGMTQCQQTVISSVEGEA
ncbi:hypothetical protein TSUD_387180 [Trifolium subterraneum]|uniref:CCHC-type domain-containing protein n=1 Tax=Trifolium subterraneum TaxID=3900 RepID=A0A2Z6PM96_TRISU|nr:hypothetical protein TSUD_387180 [Trifolium subterraneum]